MQKSVMETGIKGYAVRNNRKKKRKNSHLPLCIKKAKIHLDIFNTNPVNYHGYFKKAKNKYSKTNFELFER